MVGIVERGSETLELHIGPRPLTCTTQGWQKAEAREQARDAAEEQRLWYVAAARVRDHLIVPQRPRATPENDGAQPPVTNEREDRGTAATFFSQTDHMSMYVYESDPHIIEQTMAVGTPPEPSLHVVPHAGALHGYERWLNERHATLTRGSERISESVARGSSPFSQPTPGTVRRVIKEALRQALTEQPARGEAPALAHGLTTAPRHEVARLVNLLRTSHLLHRTRLAAEHAVAVPFVLTFQNQTLTGEIDLAFIENDAWIVAALDDGEVAPDQDEAHENDLRRSLAWQAVALEQLTGRAVHELVMLNIQTRHEHSFLWTEEVRQQFALPPAELPRERRDTP
jgi:ATP-dependent exoDNAse (exonuclease V) beta subunit